MSRYYFIPQDKKFVALHDKNALVSADNPVEVTEETYNKYLNISFLVDEVIDDHTVNLFPLPYQDGELESKFDLPGSVPSEEYIDTYSLTTYPGQICSCTFHIFEGNIYSIILLPDLTYSFTIEQGHELDVAEMIFKPFTWRNQFDTDLKVSDNHFLYQIGTYETNTPIQLRVFKDLEQILNHEYFLFLKFI